MRQTTNTNRFSRRAVLWGIAATGVAGGLGAGTASAQPNETPGGGEGRGQGQGQGQGGTQPGHEEFECPDGMDHLGTFEFVTVENDAGDVADCYFEQRDDDRFAVTVTDYESKADEGCEPISVSYESETHTVGQVSSFGGNDTHVDAEPTDGVYESELETEAGQQAAISLIHFCGTDEDRTDETGETN